ncbi:hypothetical protein KMZ68_13825 [Bradyrhizobium sediminis]|uniref:Uncharacterized protein n=1 Tax=Bradyrhizobium sediminis TaxID=2840469 RepID=A0A975RQR7_9BRAD|nr:hypothetical protein [Bradyrhizobium sediminis]QWG16123.1 hypothetical protein KMZ68_13825 [Bradyrhizobium sediminis]
MTNYIQRDVDRKNLLLPDGQRADQLRITPLRKELIRLGVPGINHEMGKCALLDQYAAHVSAVADRLPKSGGMQGRDISQTVAKQAAALIAQQAAGIDTLSPPGPSAPIATMRV